ncbi:MAG: hypothetical protein WA924_16015 [Burkholderiaceae bacterium]
MKIRDLSRLLLAVLVVLAGCASAPPAPDWQSNGYGAMQGFTSAYLKGDTRGADQEFARARAEIARTGRPDLMARAELMRCAAQVASLDIDGCPGFQALAEDAAAGERAYAAYLAGYWQDLDPALLPPPHRALLAGAGDAGRLGRIEEPLSRLVAAGVLLRSSRLLPSEIALAVDTASAQGWRRPLLAWLGVQAQRARQAGDALEAARIERRIGLVMGR